MIRLSATRRRATAQPKSDLTIQALLTSLPSLPGDDRKLVLFVVDDGSVTDQLQRYNLLVSKLGCELEVSSWRSRLRLRICESGIGSQRTSVKL